MDIYETRRKNLNLLIAQFDGPTATAKRLQHRGTSYISQLSTGRRPVTEKTARDMEKRLKLPHLWLDGEPPKGVSGPVAIDMPRLAAAVKRRSPYRTRSCATFISPIEKPLKWR